MSRLMPLSRGSLAVIASVLLSAAAQLLMKGGMLELEQLQQPLISTDTAPSVKTLGPVILWVAAGLLCYGTSILFWLAALSKYDLSFAYPMLGLSYALVYVLAVHWPYFGEELSASRTLGTILIMIGVGLVGSTAAKYNR